MVTTSSTRRITRSALQLLAAGGRQRQPQHQNQQTRSFRQSTALFARKNRRGGGASTPPTTSAVFEGSAAERNEDDERELHQWFEQMQEQQKLRGKRSPGEPSSPPQQQRFGALSEPDDDDADSEDDDDEEQDEETREFLSEVDELFALEPEAFERKMQKFDKRQSNVTRRSASSREVEEEDEDDEEDDDRSLRDADDDEEYDDDDEEYEADDEEEIERATERIATKKLVKVLDALQPGRSVRNDTSITPPRAKNAAPLEKKPKKVNVDRVSYRQERIELSVVEFVQNLIVQDSDSQSADVVANIVEASVAPDLRRVVLLWEPQRLNSDNQTISKRKVAGIERRLQAQERWIRAQVTRHLNLKYSPNVQFKKRTSAKSDEARAAFDREMTWLDRF